MRRIELQRLLIAGDRILRMSGPGLRVTEIAPAVDECRLEPQRAFVVRGGRCEPPARHVGVAKPGMHLGNDIGGDPIYTCGLRGFEPALEGGDRLIDSAFVIILLADQKLLVDQKDGILGRGSGDS